MSSQAIRSIINTSIRRVITEVEKKALSEGKKKIMELKDELLSPDQIIRMLSADINQDSCSEAGRVKMKDKADNLRKKLDKIDIIAQAGLTAMINLEEKIGTISSKAEIPNLPNPIEKIQGITDSTKEVIKILQYVVMAAPAILFSQTSVAGAGAISGTVIVKTNNNVNLAKAKIGEFVNLFQALPRVLDKYISMADKVFDNVTKIKSQIKIIIDEIAKLLLFIDYMELDFENKCNNLQSPINPPILDPPTTITPIPLTLEDIIAEIQELYGDLLEKLIAQGNYKAIRRVYKLGENFQRTINIKVEKIDI
mgnify:CR=1 FL=1